MAEDLSDLNGMDLFRSMSADELRSMSAKITLKKVKRGSVILHEEDTNEFMYIVVEGEVKVLRSNEDGKETILALHGEGQSFGEISLIDGKTAPATVAATEDTVVALIARADFYEMISTHEKFRANLLNLLCSRLRDSWDIAQMLTLKNAEERVRSLFHLLAVEKGQRDPEGITIKARLTHQGIADMTGLTRESVTRVVDRWKRAGLIEPAKQKQIRLVPDFFERDFSL